jgi:hypothetical protein
VPSDEDFGVKKPKHYEMRMECYHLECCGTNAAAGGVDLDEELEEVVAAAAAVPSWPLKAHASLPSWCRSHSLDDVVVF